MQPRKSFCSAAVLSLTLTLAATTGVALAAPGDLDPTFGAGGKLTIDYGAHEEAGSVAVQPDGKIVAVGFGTASHQFVVTRLNPDGSFDTTFGSNGVTPIVFPGHVSADANAVALQPDGRILIAGVVDIDDIAVARVNPDGSLDSSFGADGINDGKRTINYGGYESAEAMVLQRDKIVLASYDGNGRFAVTRLNADGSFDASFAGDGTSAIPLQGEPFALALQPDGKIVVAGGAYLRIGQYDLAVARINLDGTLDGEFDADGMATFNFGGLAMAEGAVVQTDGKLLIAMRGGDAGGVARLNRDGSLDRSFGVQGRSDGFASGDELAAIAQQANGKIVLAGETADTFTVTRLQPGGSLDTTFALYGKKTVGFGAFSRASALAIQRNGAIVAAGHTGPSGAADIAMARVESDQPGAGVGRSGKPLRCAGKRATIVGTEHSDRLRGTRKADVIVGLAGNDRISGLRGNDRICGGGGRDRLSGGKGRDNCNGGAGRDRATCERERGV